MAEDDEGDYCIMNVDNSWFTYNVVGPIKFVIMNTSNFHRESVINNDASTQDNLQKPNSKVTTKGSDRRNEGR